MESKSSTTRTHLLMLTLVALFLSTYNSSAGKLLLDRWDHQAVLTVQRSLGLDLVNESQTSRHPCTSSSVFCERRPSGSVPLLRVTRLRFQSIGLRCFLSPAIAKLKELSLPGNSLTDQIPPEIVYCRKLETLSLKKNLFTGSVTPQLSLLTRLRVLDLSSNHLSGNLTFLKHFLNLELLSLSDNRFSGAVPDSVWNFRHLRHFDISRNPLITGRIPNIGSLSSSAVSDVVRRSVLAEGPSSFGNGGELTPSSSPSPSSAEAPSPTAAGDVKKRKKSNKLMMVIGFVGGVIAGGITGLVISVAVKMLLRLIKGKKKTGLSIFSPNPMPTLTLPVPIRPGRLDTLRPSTTRPSSSPTSVKYTVSAWCLGCW